MFQATCGTHGECSKWPMKFGQLLFARFLRCFQGIDLAWLPRNTRGAPADFLQGAVCCPSLFAWLRGPDRPVPLLILWIWQMSR